MIKEISLRGCLEFAITTEDVGAKFCRQLAELFVNDQELANLFELLARDEEVHKQQFSELLSHLPQEAGITNAPEKSEYLRAMAISEFFSRRGGLFEDINRIENRDDALEEVFGFEKATLGFYQAVEDVLGENPTLTQVIETEKSHITRLVKVMITGEKFRSLQDKWF